MTRWLLFLLVASLEASTLFSPINMTSQVLPTPYVATASSAEGCSPACNPCPALPTPCGGNSYQPFGPFQRLGANSWTGINSGVDWLKLDLGVGNLWVLTDYAFQVNTVTRGPKDWTIQGSTDDVTYTVLDTRTNQTSWVTNVQVSFTTNAGVITPFRYFKFNITANQGGAQGQFTEVATLTYNGALTVVGTGGTVLSGVANLNGQATQK